MPMYRKYVKLDAVPGGNPVKIYISQGDKRSRHIEFSLFAREGTLELPSGTTIKLKARRPDGQELEITGSRNNLAVTFDIPESFATYDGEIPAAVTAYSGDERLTFEPVWLVCDKKEGE